MNPLHAKDHVDIVLKSVHLDERFIVSNPVFDVHNSDHILVCIDFTKNGPPYSTCPAIFRISEMGKLKGSELVHYIEMKLKSANKDLQDFIGTEALKQ